MQQHEAAKGWAQTFPHLRPSKVITDTNAMKIITGPAVRRQAYAGACCSRMSCPLAALRVSAWHNRATLDGLGRGGRGEGSTCCARRARTGTFFFASDAYVVTSRVFRRCQVKSSKKIITSPCG